MASSASGGSNDTSSTALKREPSFLFGGSGYDANLEGHSLYHERNIFYAYTFFHFANFVLATAILACALQYQKDYQKKPDEDQSSMYDQMTIVWGFAAPLMIYSAGMVLFEGFSISSRMKKNNKTRRVSGFLLQMWISLFFACFWLGFALYVGFNGWRRKANYKQKTGKGRDEEFNIECNEKTNPYCSYIKGVGYALIVGIFPQIMTLILGFYIWRTVKSRGERLGENEEDGDEYEDGEANARLGRYRGGQNRGRSPTPRGYDREPRRSPSRRPQGGAQRRNRSASPNRYRGESGPRRDYYETRFRDDDLRGHRYDERRDRSRSRRRDSYDDDADSDDDYRPPSRRRR